MIKLLLLFLLIGLFYLRRENNKKENFSQSVCQSKDGNKFSTCSYRRTKESCESSSKCMWGQIKEETQSGDPVCNSRRCYEYNNNLEKCKQCVNCGVCSKRKSDIDTTKDVNDQTHEDLHDDICVVGNKNGPTFEQGCNKWKFLPDSEHVHSSTGIRTRFGVKTGSDSLEMQAKKKMAKSS